MILSDHDCTVKKMIIYIVKLICNMSNWITLLIKSTTQTKPHLRETIFNHTICQHFLFFNYVKQLTLNGRIGVRSCNKYQLFLWNGDLILLLNSATILYCYPSLICFVISQISYISFIFQIWKLALNSSWCWSCFASRGRANYGSRVQRWT